MATKKKAAAKPTAKKAAARARPKAAAMNPVAGETPVARPKAVSTTPAAKSPASVKNPKKASSGRAAKSTPIAPILPHDEEAMRSAAGKSLMFIGFVATGYVSGVTAKLLVWHEGGVLSPVIWVYTWILGLILIDLALALRFGAGRAPRSPVR